MLLSLRVVLVASIISISFLATAELIPDSSSLINEKLLHFGCFIYLTMLSSFAKIVNQDFWLYVIVLSYGILIEVAQLYLPYRSFEFLDILADFSGILFASFFLRFVKKFSLSYWINIIKPYITNNLLI